ncbi:MAG: hypothetical protein FJ278_10890 [Planctomycetes bacterium]|nr:hypothetical protein [Planctomycetota bacterium]
MATPIQLCVVAVSFSLLASWAASAPLPSGVAGQSLDLALEGGAKIGADEELKADALALDGQPGTYARCPAPEGWGRLRNFRVDVKARIDQYRAGSVPFGWPGSFLIYISGHGMPWVLLETDQGRIMLAGTEPVPPTRWLDIAFEYRADDICLLWVNKRSVASLHGRGPLKRGGKELWLGRYTYKDEKTGKEDTSWMKGAVAMPRVQVLPDDDRFKLDTTNLANALGVSWGDAIVVNKGWRMLNKPEHAKPLVAECQRMGVKKVFLRCDHEFIMNFCERRMPDDHWYMKAIKAVEGDMMAEIIKECHAAGIKVYAYQSIFDCGSPTTYLYGGNTPYIWQSKFTIAHPEYLVESRDGKERQWGVLCYACPEARQYIISVFKNALAKWPFDGLYICTRSHSKRAEFADQFGYNAPIAEEFKRRHGVDIRTQDFSKPQWWDLQGEYLTQLLREFRQEFRDKEIHIAIPRSDYIGPPFGNMRLDWRTWCQEKLVNGLVLGVNSGAFHYPNSLNRPGYVQSAQDNLAMRPLDFDLGQWFGPVCKAAGVELYLQRSSLASDADRDLLKHPGMKGFMLGL